MRRLSELIVLAFLLAGCAASPTVLKLMPNPKSKVLYGSEGAPPTIEPAPTPVRAYACATRAYACATQALHARARAYLTG